jgi:hypothetical protein
MHILRPALIAAAIAALAPAALLRVDITDRGPVLFDGYFDKSAQEQHGHRPAGGLRGWKYLVYVGGCRVPLLAR